MKGALLYVMEEAATLDVLFRNESCGILAPPQGQSTQMLTELFRCRFKVARDGLTEKRFEQTGTYFD